MIAIPKKYHKCIENLEKDTVPADTLFHYTAWAGLAGILNTQQLWLTHYSQLNDTSEMLQAMGIIHNFIFTLVPNESMHRFWESVFVDIQNLIENKWDFFIGSFCMKRNHLYAWRDYWKGWVNEWERSGEDKTAFCRNQKLNYDLFKTLINF